MRKRQSWLVAVNDQFCGPYLEGSTIDIEPDGDLDNAVVYRGGLRIGYLSDSETQWLRSRVESGQVLSGRVLRVVEPEHCEPTAVLIWYEVPGEAWAGVFEAVACVAGLATIAVIAWIAYGILSRWR